MQGVRKTFEKISMGLTDEEGAESASSNIARHRQTFMVAEYIRSRQGGREVSPEILETISSEIGGSIWLDIIEVYNESQYSRYGVLYDRHGDLEDIIEALIEKTPEVELELSILRIVMTEMETDCRYQAEHGTLNLEG